jgi:hypothetical protein
MLRLHLVLHATLLLDPQRERSLPPRLHVWLSRNVSEAFHDIELTASEPDPALNPLADAAPSVCARVDAQLDFALADPAAPQACLDALCAGVLNVDAYCSVVNVHGETCTNQAGCASIALAELVGPRVATPYVRADLTYPMLDAGDNGLKGALVFDTRATQLTWRGQPVAACARGSWRVPQGVDSPLDDYIGRQEQQFGMQMASTWGFLANINIFEYRCRVGRLPAAAYIDSPLGRTSEAYYENAARCALRMHGVDEAHALGHWGRAESSRDECRAAAYWLASLLSLYVQACDYLTDAVIAWSQPRRRFEKVPIEWFYQTRVRRGTLDCEDGSMETMVQALELERLRDVRSPLVRLAQRVKAAFYCVLLLDAVSAGEINLAPAAAPAHLDAHMNSALISRAQFAAMARNTNTCAQHGPSAAEAAAAAAYPPIVMMEATGPLDPNGVEHAEADEAAEAALDRMLDAAPMARARLRRIFHYDGSGRRQSGFYKAVKVMSTAELARRGCGQYLWMMCDAKRGTAGVPFQAVAAAERSVAIRAEDELSGEQRTLMDEYRVNLHPQPALQPPGAEPDAPHMARAREHVTRLRAALAALVRSASGAPAHRAVRVAKHHAFDARGALLDELTHAAARAFGTGRPRLVGFDALEYAATPDRGFFHLVFDMEL